MATGFTGLSFSGADVRAYAAVPGGGFIFLDSLQTISVSVYRDKQPVRALGFQNVTGHTRGQRTIAGSLIFALVNKHPLKKLYKKYQYDYSLDTGYGTTFFPDQIPPFTMILFFQNEAGNRGMVVIHGVDLTNDGMVTSIEDMLTENTYQYRAFDLRIFNDLESHNKSPPLYAMDEPGMWGPGTDLDPETVAMLDEIIADNENTFSPDDHRGALIRRIGTNNDSSFNSFDPAQNGTFPAAIDNAYRDRLKR